MELHPVLTISMVSLLFIDIARLISYICSPNRKRNYIAGWSPASAGVARNGLLTLQQKRIYIAKLKIYTAMVSSTNHVLNNFLNKMYLFKITAEDIPEFPSDVLELYDHIVDEASAQIESLGSVTELDESSIRASVAPQ